MILIEHNAWLLRKDECKMTDLQIQYIMIIGAIAICVLIFAIEFIYLFLLAKAQTRKISVYEKNKEYIEDKLNYLFDNPSTENPSDTLMMIKRFIGEKRESFDVLSDIFFERLDNVDSENDYQQRVLFDILNIIDPINFYSNLLKKGNTSEKAHACRMLADYSAEDQSRNIEKHMNSRDVDLSYNSAIALSKLGNEEGVFKFVLGCTNNYTLSHRMVLQLFGEYNKDVKALAALIFRECDDYIKATVIKSIAKYKFDDFEDVYLEALKSDNASLRVAAVTAIGSFNDPKYERELIKTSNDKMWIVRNAAVKALGNLNTETALKSVIRAMGDNEWWVRYNAAKTLIEMDEGMEHIEEILSSTDRYAADSLKYALYRNVN